MIGLSHQQRMMEIQHMSNTCLVTLLPHVQESLRGACKDGLVWFHTNILYLISFEDQNLLYTTKCIDPQYVLRIPKIGKKLFGARQITTIHQLIIRISIIL